MIRAAIRLGILYFVAWLISTQVPEAAAFYRRIVGQVLQAGPFDQTFWVLTSFAAVALLWHLLGLGFWVLAVPLDRRAGPRRHPFPDQPLRIQLRFKLTRFLGALLLTITGLLLAFRAMEALVAPTLTVPWPEIAFPATAQDTWLSALGIHLAAAGIAWLILTMMTALAARSRTRPYGFAPYQHERKPVLRMYWRIALFGHFPLTGFAAASHPHPLLLASAAGSLLALLMVATIAQWLTLRLEARHDRWLDQLESAAAGDAGSVDQLDGFSSPYHTWARTLRFLHPEMEFLPQPKDRSSAATEPFSDKEADGERTAGGDPASNEPHAASQAGGESEARQDPWSTTPPDSAAHETVSGAERGDVWSGGDAPSVESATPFAHEDAAEVIESDASSAPPSATETASAPVDPGEQVLALAIARIEAKDYKRARRLLADAAAVGSQATRERAEALTRTLPGTRLRFRVAVAAVTLPLLAGLLLVGWEWFNLPSGAETLRLARSAHIHVRKSSDQETTRVALLGTRYDYSLNTGLENISEHFINAVVASEDHRFFEHGVSYKVAKFAQAGVLCVFRKLNPLAASRACAGNSTLPQQLARNLFLSETRTIRRKLTELLWAIKMEASLSKQEVLELYMNRIYLGKGNFGVEMAARDYFGKSASRLSLKEAVYLAAAIKRPNWNWKQDRDSALKRAQIILALMKRHGYADSAVTLDANFRPAKGRRALQKPYLGHLWQWVRPTVREVVRDLPDGDYKVLTSLNAEVEVYAERHLTAAVRRLQRRGIRASQGALVAMRTNGEVLAMVGGVGDDVTARGFNRAKRTQGMHARPAASSFKPFVYLAALEKGLTPETYINAGPVEIPIPGAPQPYRPRNHDGREYGEITMREGLVRSINTAAVHLLHDHIGFDRLFETVERVGIKTNQWPRQWGAALGQNAVPLIEMVGAYGTFATGGRRVRPHAVLAVTTESGRTVWRRSNPRGKRVISRTVMNELDGMLRQVVSNGTGHRAANSVPAEVIVAGKTGTGDGFVDAWFLGYTSEIVIGVWIGNDQPKPMPGVYGGTEPARVFNALLRDLLAYTEVLGPPLQ